MEKYIDKEMRVLQCFNGYDIIPKLNVAWEKQPKRYESNKTAVGNRHYQ